MKYLSAFLSFVLSLNIAGCAVFNDRSPSPEHGYQASNSTHLRALKQLAISPSLVQGVERANAANANTQQQIDQIDQAWITGDDTINPLVQEVIGNPISDYLRRIQRVYPEYLELFVIDNKGCVIAANHRTSDYWQGDEAKWNKIFKQPDLEYFVDDIELDLSVNAYLHHYSLPIRSTSSELLGVLVVGVSVN